MNPKAGVKKGALKKEHLLQVLDPDLFNVKVFETNKRRHATKLSKQAIDEGCDVLLICGGDGTINECIQSVIGHDIFVGILPTGSGNGLSRHTGIGPDFLKAIDFINGMKWRYIDAVKLNGKYFINIAGIGFDGYLTKKIEDRTYRGMWLYVWLFLSHIWRYKAKNYEIITDDKTFKGQYMLIVIANSPMYGYDFKIAPGADIADGLLDVMILEKVSFWRLFRDLPKIIRNNIDGLNWSHRTQTKSLTIKTDRKIHLHVDGEYRKIKLKEVHAEVLPKAVKLIVP